MWEFWAWIIGILASGAVAIWGASAAWHTEKARRKTNTERMDDMEKDIKESKEEFKTCLKEEFKDVKADMKELRSENKEILERLGRLEGQISLRGRDSE